MNTSALDVAGKSSSSPVKWSQVPAVWLVIAIPATAVIVGFIMLSISIAAFDGVVVDDYYKLGKEINRVLDRDSYASENGVTANLMFNLESKLVNVRMDSDKNIDFPGELKLSLLHPTRSGRDVVILLRKTSANAFQGLLLPTVDGRWIAQLTTAEWRLSRTIILSTTTEKEFLLKPLVRVQS